MNTITRNERSAHVSRMRHNFALEGLHPDPQDAALQAAYVEGIVSFREMLAYATAFALKHAAPAPQITTFA